MHHQELGAAEHLHIRVVDEKWSMAGLHLPVTPAYQLLHLLLVSKVIPDEAHHCVIRKLHNVVGGSPWDTVVSHHSEQQGARDTALRRACAEGDDTGDILTDTDCGLSVRKSSSQLHRGVLKPRGPSLSTRCCRMMY